MSEVQFDGATAFITGGAQGIGLGIAHALAKRGVKLAIVDIDKDALAAAESNLRAMTSTQSYVLDVRDRVEYARIADEVESSLGPVNLLFNNAGVATGGLVEDMTYEGWDFTMDINVGGVVNGIQTFLPRIIGRGQGGYVVNTASGAGLVAAGTGYLYTTSKFAVVGLSEALHLELKDTGIGVSVLCPGPVATKIVSNTVRHQVGELRDDSYQRSDSEVSMAEGFLAQGVQPDAVGEMVVAAMQKDQLHIHTDTMMAEGVAWRAKLILDAMPVSG
jgi:NAD(P)-dependent dehydrogenase (short-subunit alcohol dehydrogenase family)